MGIEGTKSDLRVIGLRSPIQFVDPVSRLHSRWLIALHPHHEIPMRKTQFEGKSDKIGKKMMKNRWGFEEQPTNPRAPCFNVFDL
jgi:hypothetical protein